MARRTNTPTVQELAERGIPLAAAVHAVLAARGSTLSDWCRAGGHNIRHASGLLRGSAGSPYHSIREALARAFGLERSWLDAELDRLAGRGTS